MDTTSDIQADILSELGIKSIYPDINSAGISPHVTCNPLISNIITTQDGWRLFKERHSLVSLWKLFKRIKAISFCEWARLAHGTDAWDGLLSEVIKPLPGNDRAFIFQLGDVRIKKFLRWMKSLI